MKPVQIAFQEHAVQVVCVHLAAQEVPSSAMTASAPTIANAPQGTALVDNASLPAQPPKHQAHTARAVTVKALQNALQQHVLQMPVYPHAPPGIPLPTPIPAPVLPTPIAPLAIAHHPTSVPTPAQSARALDRTMTDVTVHQAVTVSQIHVRPICVPPPVVDLLHITMTVDVPATPSVVQGSALRLPTHANQPA